MKKIKFRLEKWNRALVFQVLEMDNRFLSKNSEEKKFHHSDGLVIKSAPNQPVRICDKSVYLWGENYDYHSQVAVKQFESNFIRDEMFQKILKTLHAWALEWHGFQEDYEIKNREGEQSVLFEF